MWTSSTTFVDVRAAVALMLLFTACSELRERPDPDTCPNTLHPCGITDPADPEFHGKLIEREGWDLNVCASCHGADFSGGPSGATCLTCHQQGPTACDTCHDTPPASGAWPPQRGRHASALHGGRPIYAFGGRPALWPMHRRPRN